MDLHPDFRDLLAELARSKVSYAVLGGYAVSYHAKARATDDLDLLLSGLNDNLQRAADALAAFGVSAPLVERARTLKPTEIVYIGAPPVRVDLLCAADGIETESVLARAELAFVNGLSIPIIALDDLIANKRASARPQDLADVALLERAQAIGDR